MAKTDAPKAPVPNPKSLCATCPLFADGACGRFALVLDLHYTDPADVIVSGCPDFVAPESPPETTSESPPETTTS